MRLDLKWCAQLENMAHIKLDENDDWHFRIKCGVCNEEFENVVYFNLIEK